tara:strand:- start:35 stop:661 length:627 start_codon:yes stop_codon:yes gene_type:complete
MREHPIPPVTEALQYRAIGLVRGIYRPTDPEVFSRGLLRVDQDEDIDAVVLGKVISLMKRHISLESSHLWVVYPRCRDSEHLHLQISGIWEPSTLNKPGLDKTPLNKKEEELNQLAQGENYFSIRGELIFTKPDDSELVIKIRQGFKPGRKKALPFKLKLKGKIPFNYLRNFISLDVIRLGQELHVESYKIIEGNRDQDLNKENQHPS